MRTDVNTSDFYGGHCVTGLGHCPDAVVKAVQEQVGKLIFYSNVNYSPARARAAAALVSIAPDHLKRCFFLNSGTEATKRPSRLPANGGDVTRWSE